MLEDRGFDITDSVGMMQATLHNPAFTKGKSQLSAMEVSHYLYRIYNRCKFEMDILFFD